MWIGQQCRFESCPRHLEISNLRFQISDSTGRGSPTGRGKPIRIKMRLSLQTDFARSLAESNVRSNPPLKCWCNSGLRLLVAGFMRVQSSRLAALTSYESSYYQTIRRSSSREERNGSQSDRPDLNGIVSESLEVPVQPPPACKGTTLGALLFTPTEKDKIV